MHAYLGKRINLLPNMTNRVLSIDVLRGFTIFMMVFVNDLAGVSNIPDWMKHIPAGENGMTFVDVVFPAFLFIVGMAIPLAVRTRLLKDKSRLAFWLHVLTRSLGLIVLGVFMVNAEEMNREANLIPAWLWSVLLYVAAILIWNAYPKSSGREGMYKGLKILGIAILVLLYFTYRKGEIGNLSGMTNSWWGILGLIGWAYLYTVVLFMLKRRWWFIAIVITLILMLVSWMMKEGSEFPYWLEWIKSQRGHLVHTSIVLAGVLTSLVVIPVLNTTQHGKALFRIGIAGLVFYLAGIVLAPLGIAKIGATPAWAMYSAAICAATYLIIYWLIEVRTWRSWSAFLKPAGQNPLLTYILPFIVYAIVTYPFLGEGLNTGLVGFLKAVVFSLIILKLAEWMTNRGIRLRL